MPRVSVATTATSLLAANNFRKVATFRNESSGTIFMDTVDTLSTTSAKWFLDEKDAISLEDEKQQIFGIVASGTSNVFVAEETRSN